MAQITLKGKLLRKKLLKLDLNLMEHCVRALINLKCLNTVPGQPVVHPQIQFCFSLEIG